MLLPTSRSRLGVAAMAVAALTTSLCATTFIGPAASSAVDPPLDGVPSFDRLATYPVFLNVPDDVDPSAETVAEIAAATEDGNTVIYTDAAGQRIGFLDITDPSNPVGAGTIDLRELGDTHDEPTSVEVVGDYVLVVVDTSDGDFEHPTGRVDVVRISDRTRVRSIDLGGQPDSIKVSPDQSYAAIAIENQRDEDFIPPGGDEGDLPQAPTGFVTVLGLNGAPEAWTVDAVALPPEDLPGVFAPTDVEPEYVDINADNKLALSLQENNALVVIDLASKEVDTAFSLGNAQVSGIDTDDDGVFDFTDTIDVPREPDAIAWVGENLVATANEGDLYGGSRGWSVFDVSTGAVVWDAGNSFEYLAAQYGLFNDGRADNKGAEPEGMAFDTIGGTPYVFVGAERSNFVAVYDMSDPTDPVFRQVLPTTNGPEGLLPIPERDLLVVSSEVDDADALVRATVGVYQLGDNTPAFPALISAQESGQAPIGWGAISGLSPAPGEATTLYAVSDSAFATGRIYTIDASTSPAVITDALDVSEARPTVAGAESQIAENLDLEGVAARADGGFWLANEGKTGADNSLIRTDGDGLIQERIELPEDVAAGLGKNGLEGIAVQGVGSTETVTVVLQRALEGETAARIGRYDVAAQTWTWFGYPLESTSTDGDFIGLSEVSVVDAGTVAIIERDKQNGTTAAIKRVYTVDLPAGDTATVTPVTKTLALDLLPTMQSLNGWTQEKLEGLAIAADGTVYAATDNDGVDDATGETQFFAVNPPAPPVTPTATATSTKLTASKRSVRSGKQVNFKVRVRPGTSGQVKLVSQSQRVGTITLNTQGRGNLRLRLSRPGLTKFRAVFLGDVDSKESSSDKVAVRVLTKRR